MKQKSEILVVPPWWSYRYILNMIKSRLTASTRLVDTQTKIKVKGQTVQTGELGHTNGQTDGRTLPSTLSPRFAVDKNLSKTRLLFHMEHLIFSV